MNVCPAWRHAWPKRRQIPDHGEVWSASWQLEDAELSSEKIALSVSLPISPFEFTRTVSLNQWTVNFDYRLRNRSDHPAHFLWAFHPLLRIEPGDELHVLRGLSEVELETASWPEDKQGDKWLWPRPRTGIDLEKLDLGEKPAYAKCFLSPLPRRNRYNFKCSTKRGDFFSPSFALHSNDWLLADTRRMEWTSPRRYRTHQRTGGFTGAGDGGAIFAKPIAPRENIDWSFRIFIEIGNQWWHFGLR